MKNLLHSDLLAHELLDEDLDEDESLSPRPRRTLRTPDNGNPTGISRKASRHEYADVAPRRGSRTTTRN